MTATATEVLVQAMTERQLQDAVVELARRLGYLVYHPYDSRRSAEGFPDLTIVGHGRGLLFAELKSATGRLSDDQRTWQLALSLVGVETHVWRPADWHSGLIERVLRGEEQTA